jgi:hypothetical protein
MGTDNEEGFLPEGSLEDLPRREREDIQRRRQWFDDQFQQYGYAPPFAPGGTWETGRMTTEVREAYAQGFYISTVILSFSVLERLLTYELLFHGEVKSHEREGVEWKEVHPQIIKDILPKTTEMGIIDEELEAEIEELNEIRKAYVHYRHFNHPESRSGQWERDQGSEVKKGEEVEEDAEKAIVTMTKVAGSADRYFNEKVEESGDLPES